MGFSVVEIGYDRQQVETCLVELAAGLNRLIAYAEGATGPADAWEHVRREATGLRSLVTAGAGSAPARRLPSGAAREVAETLARARAELRAAREDARRVRECAYAEALQARREVEAALDARRRREARVVEILRAPATGLVPPETATAAAAVPAGGVPVTRSATAGAADVAVETAVDRAG